MAIEVDLHPSSKQPENRVPVSTVTAKATLLSGLSCRVVEGEHKILVDMPKAHGGGGTGPNPGVFVRAGIASCVAMSLRAEAVRSGIELSSVSVDLEMDFDDRAGSENPYPAPLETRLIIGLDGASGDTDLLGLIRRVLDGDPYVVALRDPLRVKAIVQFADTPT